MEVGGLEEGVMGGLEGFLVGRGLRIGRRSLGSWSGSGGGFSCCNFVCRVVFGFGFFFFFFFNE